VNPELTLYRRAVLPGREAGTWPGRLGAVLVGEGRIVWVGPDGDAPAAAAVVDLDGALLLPAFTDAHVHVTETGLHLDGVDLSASRSVTEVLDAVAAHARRRPGHQVLGHGWDELNLAEGRPPTAAELDRAGGGLQVYLSRVDVHSAVVSTSLAAAFALKEQVGWNESGRIERDAHHVARHATRFEVPAGRRTALQQRALAAAAAAGIGEVHEMSAPHIAPDHDLPMLLSLDPDGPVVVPYRGEAVRTPAEARAVAGRLGLTQPLAGLAGDLMVDGSIGSRTACLAADYTDAPGVRGHLYLSVGEIRDHVVACTRAGLQAGFHVIGDGAVAAVTAGLSGAASVVGVEAMRAARHRLEHLGALDDEAVAECARLGVIASVQPAFDAAWGGDSGMYARRLGVQRARQLNPFAALVAAGVPLAFGSDTPVTPFAPWEAVRAALLHRTPDHRLGAGTALHAHTLGAHAAARPAQPSSAAPGFATSPGSRPAGSPDRASGLPAEGERPATPGVPVVRGLATYGLSVGAPATFAVWAWSAGDGAEPISAVAAALRAGEPAPTARLTVVNGRIVFREN
jgi:predicted amidohydrolase YtcJ